MLNLKLLHVVYEYLMDPNGFVSKQQPQLPRVVVIYLNRYGHTIQSLEGNDHNYDVLCGRTVTQ